MSRTGIDASTFAQDLREMAGDGSIDWVNQPFQAAALLDIADMLDDNAKLRKENDELCIDVDLMNCQLRARAEERDDLQYESARLRKLVRISIEYCNSGTCDGCPIQGDDGSCPYAEMALNLGVEVKQ